MKIITTFSFPVALFLFSGTIGTACGQSVDSADWKETIGNHTHWSSSIENHIPVGYAPRNGVEFILEDSILQISDFTGGLFSYYNDSKPYPVEIVIDDGNVLPIEIMTPYGPCKISGYWDSLQNALRIRWIIEFNKINEVTTFTIN